MKISPFYDAIILLFGNKKHKAHWVNSCKKKEINLQKKYSNFDVF